MRAMRTPEPVGRDTSLEQLDPVPVRVLDHRDTPWRISLGAWGR